VNSVREPVFIAATMASFRGGYPFSSVLIGVIDLQHVSRSNILQWTSASKITMDESHAFLGKPS